MNKEQIEKLCQRKAEELIEKYFGNLAQEAANDCPETIGEYDKELPLRIEKEYRDYLAELWTANCADDTRTVDDILDKPHIRELMTEDDREGIADAYQKAQQITMWEKITKTNHKDVTYYKGLLEVYTRELLFCLRHDFMEEIKEK